ncbi:unnamed protein product, partial [Eretmochelys imbricata]
TLDMTNLAYDLDALDLELEEAEGLENPRSPKASISSVTTSPSNVKHIPFFKKVKESGVGLCTRLPHPRSRLLLIPVIHPVYGARWLGWGALGFGGRRGGRKGHGLDVVPLSFRPLLLVSAVGHTMG